MIDVLHVLTAYTSTNVLLSLTYPLQHQFSSQRVAQPLSKLSAIPYEQLLVWQDWLDGVEIDVHLFRHTETRSTAQDQFCNFLLPSKNCYIKFSSYTEFEGLKYDGSCKMYIDAKSKSETDRIVQWLGYALDDQEVVVQIPAEARDYIVL